MKSLRVRASVLEGLFVAAVEASRIREASRDGGNTRESLLGLVASLRQCERTVAEAGGEAMADQVEDATRLLLAPRLLQIQSLLGEVHSSLEAAVDRVVLEGVGLPVACGGGG